MELKVLTKQNYEFVRQWRNIDLRPWRTSYYLTVEMQEDDYNKRVANRNSNCRFWGVHDEVKRRHVLPSGMEAFLGEMEFIGMVGLADISLENHNAEMTIIINPDLTRKGYGTKALLKLLDVGFNQLNLDSIYSEAYECNPNIEFWRKTLERADAYQTMLPDRKYWDGVLYDSIYFTFFKEDFKHYVRSLQ